MARGATEKLTGGEALVRSLIAEGVETVFGLPGIQLDPMFNALHDAGNAIRVVNARHEQGTAYMAYGYAASTGKVGTYAVVPGPGLLNTTAALSTAFGNNTRVLALTGQIPSGSIGRGHGMLHEIPHQLEVMQGLTKYAARIDHPSQAPAVVSEAFRQLRSGRARPVGLEMAMDVMWQKAMVELRGQTEADAPPEPDPDAIEKAARLIGNAKQPMIFIGGGAYEAGAEIKALAEMLQAPVVAYQNGRGTLDERHYLAHTSTGGAILWRTCDVAIAIGSRLQGERMTWGMDDDIKVVHIDIDPTEINRVMKPDVGIVADAAEATALLVNALAKHNIKRNSREGEMLGVKAEAAEIMETKAGPQMGWLRAMREVLPEDGLFIDEFTQVGYVSRVGFPVYKPRHIVTPGYQGTLGYGYATSLGVKVAHPDKAVLSINGDGGFMFTMNEIATAVHHGINLVAVVFADGAYGNVMRMQKDLYDNKVIASQFTNPDFVKLAESFGALGLRTDTPDGLKAALETGFAANRPTIIEVPVGVFPEPFDVIRPPATRGKKG
jgi:acetolactate synthase I/II/III large subunit